MVTVSQGEIWWADVGEPRGSKAAFKRPVLIIQGDGLNRSRIATVVCVALTSNLRWASAPGNVALSAAAAGLPKDSVVNVSQIVTLNRSELTDCVGKLPRAKLELVLSGVDVVLGR